MFTCMCSCVLYPHAYLSQSLEYTQFIYKLFTQAQLYVFLYYTVFIFSGVNAIILICIFLFSSSLLLIPPLGTGAPQKKMLFKVCFMSYTQALFLSFHHQEGSVPFFLHCTRLPGSCLSQTLSQSCTVELYPR